MLDNKIDLDNDSKKGTERSTTSSKGTAGENEELFNRHIIGYFNWFCPYGTFYIYGACRSIYG